MVLEAFEADLAQLEADQFLHGQSGIIGDSGETEYSGCMDGFFVGILIKCCTILNGLWQRTKVSE